MDVSNTMVEYFCVLAEELHYGRAAQRLRIASPSLSQQIARFEDRVGARLFDRGPRRVALTPAGRSLLPVAEAARRAHQGVLDWARDRREGEVLRVGVVASGPGPLLTAILAAVLERMPEVRLELRRLGFFDAGEALLHRSVDAAIAPAPLPFPPEIRTHRIATEGRVLVVPAAHPLAAAGSIGIGEADGEVFIVPAAGDAAVVDWWVVDPRPSGLRPVRGPRADDIEGILELVAAGHGVNIAAASAADSYRRSGLAFVPIRDVPPVETLLCTVDRDAPPVVRAFERIALDVARVSAGV